jgi:hypothetical protein
MQIWHRGHIGIEHKDFLEANEIKHEPRFSVKYPSQLRDYIFEIPENHPAFHEIMGQLSREYTHVVTFFTDEERLTATWCIIWGVHSIVGYRIPQGYGWSEEYFHNQCKTCGGQWKQFVPLRLKREPTLGKNQFCGFGGGFELFCTPLVLDEFARQGISGFETWPLLLKKNGGERARNLKQIMVSEIAEPAVAEELVEHDRYGQTDCPVCGQTWHAHYVRGMLPLRRAALKPNVDFQLTNEWFGNGSSARREILVSQRVVRLILENKWKGAELIPIQAV